MTRKITHYITHRTTFEFHLSLFPTLYISLPGIFSCYFTTHQRGLNCICFGSKA